MDVTHSLKTDIFEHSKSCSKVTRNAGKSMRLILRLFLVCLFATYGVLALAQVSFDSQEELEKAAAEYFDNAQYDQAKPLYSQLLSLNALDPNYNYRFGACILFTEADPLKPLPYIEGGANTAGVNNEAYYFLGKAYQLNYRFDDAISFYQKAQKTGFTAPGIDLAKSIEECRNGKLLYSNVEFTPAQDKEVIETEFYRPYDFRKLKGKVIPMPPSFKTKYDQKNLTGTVVYTPTNSQTLIYASFGEEGANAKDLYQVNRLPNGEWALPQRLPDNINTKYDEDFAFYDDESSTLYFASKGHNTMGGYDIFRSTFSAQDNSWSQPVNLQYPINSPFDDFLYVSDPNGKVAFFTSRRASELGKLRVFKTLLHDPSQVELSIVEGTYEDKTDSVFNYMLATVFDPKTNKVIGKYRSNKETGKYVLILPPQNDYRLDVGPNEAAGFKFDFDVPKHDESKPLQQSIAYDSNEADGTVTVTNYFNASGKQDTVSLAANRAVSEVESAMVALPDPSTVLATAKETKPVIPVQDEKEKADRLAELAAQEEAKLMAELAKNDSVERVKKAAREAELARLQAEAARKDSIAQVEETKTAQLAAEKALQDSLAAVELKLAAAREKFIADSIATADAVAVAAKMEQQRLDSIAEAERLAALKLVQEQSVTDSLEAIAIAKAEEERKLARERAINDSIAEVERLAFEAILAKEKARKDSIEAAELVAKNESETEEQQVDDLLKEMQEKEAEILAEQARLDSMKAAETVSSELEQAQEAEELSVEASVQPERDSSLTQDVISEADLFLETIAQLEDQQAAQKEEVEKENQRIAAKKEKQKAELKEASALGSVGSTVDSVRAKVEARTDELAVSDSINQALEETKDIKAQSVALKSDADPNEYLAALAEIEAKMAEDESENTKSYELVELEPVADVPSDVDPKLQQMLDADRKALEEHQRLAAEKERELKEQLAKDKQSLEIITQPEAEDELAAIEAEMLNDLENKKSGSKLVVETAENSKSVPQVKDATSNAATTIEKEETEPQSVLIAEADELVSDLIEEESVEMPKAEAKADTKTVDDQPEVIENVSDNAKGTIAEQTGETESTEAELIAEADEIVSEILNEERPKSTEQLQEVEAEEKDDSGESVQESEELAIESEEIVTGEQEVLSNEEAEVASADTSMQEEQIEMAEKPEELPEDVDKAEPEVVEAMETKYEEETEKELESSDEMVFTEFGQRIPFLTPALRDYGKRPKPNFNAIENATMRRMVVRMRAEDIGRLAVIKNMKNQWVDQGKTQEALTEIKDNIRNQEVLANLIEPVSRKEKIREPFDRNDRRSREGVHYQLEFKLVSDNVSEAVTEAMSAEQEMTCAMPEFIITTDYFENLADARAEMRYYQQRGFDNVKVIAYQNGDRIMLSDAKNIPFVD